MAADDEVGSAAVATLSKEIAEARANLKAMSAELVQVSERAAVAETALAASIATSDGRVAEIARLEAVVAKHEARQDARERDERDRGHRSRADSTTMAAEIDVLRRRLDEVSAMGYAECDDMCVFVR